MALHSAKVRDNLEFSGGTQTALGTVTAKGANTGTAGAGLSLIADTTVTNGAAVIMNDFAALQEDIAANAALLSAIRDALVGTGFIKGT